MDPEQALAALDEFSLSADASVGFIREDDDEDGSLEIVANREGWLALADYCRLIADVCADMGTPDSSWEARHLDIDFSPRGSAPARVSVMVNGKPSPESAHWVMFLHSDLTAEEIVLRRRALADDPGSE